ncbi:hypothetical protein [Rubritalea marina]|uniref:hypothetical protein n=1 Tax=Rubritalea marina TaxID=361055 RepID=UPI0012EA4820|nr:hypothetical protein [Rubritalea marina]
MLSLCGVATAATTITLSEANAIGGTSSLGTLSVSNARVDLANGRARDMTYVIEDLDFNDDGIPDPVTVVIRVEPVGLNGRITRSNSNGSFGYRGDNRASISATDERMLVSVQSISVAGGYNIAFDGFEGLSFRGYDNNDRHAFYDGDGAGTGETVGDANLTGDSIYFSTLQQTIEVGYAENLDPGDPTNDLNNGYRLASYNFVISSTEDVVAIPEPSAAAMFWIAGLGVLLRRSKSTLL